MKNNTFLFLVIWHLLSVGACTKKLQKTVDLPPINKSTYNISKVQFIKDTIPAFFKNINDIYFNIQNKENINYLFSVNMGLGYKIKNTETDSFKFNSFIHTSGTFASNIIKSNLIEDSLVYFIENDKVWRFNILTNKYTHIENLSAGLKSNSGTVFFPNAGINLSNCITYHNQTKTLYFPVYTNQKRSKELFIGYYNLASNKKGVLDIVMPAIENNSTYRTLQDNMVFTMLNDTLVVGFGFSDLGLKIDLTTNKVEEFYFGGETALKSFVVYNKENTPDPKTRVSKTMMYATYYKNLCFNYSKEHYYRILYMPLEEDNINGFKNTFDDKQLSLVVFDKNLRLIRNIKLPEDFNYLGYYIFPTDNGVILINAGNSQTRESLEGSLIKHTINYD